MSVIERLNRVVGCVRVVKTNCMMARRFASEIQVVEAELLELTEHLEEESSNFVERVSGCERESWGAPGDETRSLLSSDFSLTTINK
jgi:hypothetical protein